jgi:Putative auto-transporter adhesin, head GIN domain
VRPLHLALGLLLLTSCQSGGGLQGDGAAKTETRPVGAFTAVDAATSVDVTVTHGAAGPLTVTADTNLLPLLETEVRGGTLIVRFTSNVRPTVAKITVPAPHLSGVHGAAGAHLRADGLDEDALAVDASAGADVHVAGKAKSLAAQASAGAVLDAAGLEAPTVTVHASSGAKMSLGAADTVTGDASSGASVTFRGEPKHQHVTTSSGASVGTAN